MPYRHAVLAAGLLLGAAAHAQDLSNPVTAAEDALSQLESAGKQRLLASNVLGSEVQSPSGERLGRIEDLVMVPGGRVVVALVDSKDGDVLPVPYTAVKASNLSA